MPHEGVEFVPRKELLTYEEMLRLTRIMVEMGISKVRITGGEPFVRKNMYGFLKRLTAIDGLEKVNITTNGAIANRHVPFLKEIGIHTINLSLDTLDKARYEEITRRDFFDSAMSTFNAVLDAGIRLKVNMVVMADLNKQDIIPMALLAQHNLVNIRFIEEMPFNGTGKRNAEFMNHKAILEHLKTKLPELTVLPSERSSTATNYTIDGFVGNIGIIAAWSRTFCSDCNRIRVTSTGQMINCLYDEGVLNLKRLLSDGSSDIMIKEAVTGAYQQKKKDGKEAEDSRVGDISESMSSIGG